jgi:hypothetical protein
MTRHARPLTFIDRQTATSEAVCETVNRQTQICLRAVSTWLVPTR